MRKHYGYEIDDSDFLDNDKFHFIVKKLKTGDEYYVDYSLRRGLTCTCKAIAINGKRYYCKHKLMILKLYIIHEKYSDILFKKDRFDPLKTELL